MRVTSESTPEVTDPGPRLPLQSYREAAEARGIAWTQLREDVIRFLWRKRRPCGAYQIARGLGKDGLSRHANSVYRVLRPFEKAGLVLSVVSRRAFLLVPDPGERWWGVSLCVACDRFAAVPMQAAGERLRSLLAAAAFLGRSFSLECLGRCCRCPS